MTCSLYYYPGYQRFVLACDAELRRPQADTSSAFGRRHDRNRKPRMKSLWHPCRVLYYWIWLSNDLHLQIMQQLIQLLFNRCYAACS